MLLNVACSSDKVSIPKPDLEPISNFNIIRLDKSIQNALNTKQLSVGEIELCYFTNIFGNVLQGQNLSIEQLLEILPQYGGYVESVDSAVNKFSDIRELEHQLADAFARYAYFFQPDSIPKVFAFSSEYQYAAISCGKGAIGIGLDMYFGSDYERYQQLQYPEYMYEHFEPYSILPDICYTLMMEHFGTEAPTNSVLEAMIHNGKILFGVDLMLPDIDDQYKMKFTSAEMNWLQENELNVWNKLIADEVLYSRITVEFRKLIMQSPNVSGFPPETPGNIGSWIGQQIVRTFMANNPNVTVQELAQLSAKEILDRSKYKPN